ncbi:MAG: hypothetical protein H7A18_06990 [Sinobacteraceae bacterium]|nr:hypothetical protein [Nevskiaceae bacterium]MCP5340028.1 hypothetical protein [Nevskiaceae bacterium]MCP5466485.1 hypothetical protein [Nevskiaceae bacterium]MCP5471812.1 hypothetical protein [Nevskiaceae bacterium]
MLGLTPNDTAVRNDPVAQLALWLAKELWVLKDRQLVLEAVLAQQGIPVRELIERWQPTDADRATIDASRRRFAEEVVATLEGPDDRR